MNNQELINSLKEVLPQTDAIIGYGSGMYAQKGYTENDKPDKDVIIVTPNFRQFLSQNYEMNREHFSPDFDKKNLEKKGKESYYSNIGCLKFEHEGYRFKAMVISTETLKSDLRTWKHFGMAGRLTKPIMYENIPQDLEELIKQNRQNLVNVALLSHPEEVMTVKDFYYTLSKLTYSGDFRTILPGEKKTKYKDIVDGALVFYEDTYKDLIKTQEIICYNTHPIKSITELPLELQNEIYSALKTSDIENIDESKYKEIASTIKKYFYTKNLNNSIKLAIASGTTLGVKETIKHGMHKFKKSLKK